MIKHQAQLVKLTTSQIKDKRFLQYGVRYFKVPVLNRLLNHQHLQGQQKGEEG